MQYLSKSERNNYYLILSYRPPINLKPNVCNTTTSLDVFSVVIHHH